MNEKQINIIIKDIELRLEHLNSVTPTNQVANRIDELRQLKNRIIKERLLK